MRYRSKPFEIDAYQLTKELIAAYLFDGAELPGVTLTASRSHPGRREVYETRQYVETLQGERVFVQPGEWIVKEFSGDGYYPIADAAFRAKYEPTN